MTSNVRFELMLSACSAPRTSSQSFKRSLEARGSNRPAMAAGRRSRRRAQSQPSRRTTIALRLQGPDRTAAPKPPPRPRIERKGVFPGFQSRRSMAGCCQRRDRSPTRCQMRAREQPQSLSRRLRERPGSRRHSRAPRGGYSASKDQDGDWSRALPSCAHYHRTTPRKVTTSCAFGVLMAAIGTNAIADGRPLL
jgi:hypothetical protein